ncbi:MAG: hypothetical protein FWG66_02710 [Spirochaetes bacterium]|nr:hypothetical protein [Spirochaetota bacterium]
MKGAENRTELYTGGAAEKSHPVIFFRGKLDSLCALIVETQFIAEEEGRAPCAGDLQEVLEYIRSIFASEYTGNPLQEAKLAGLSFDEIRERSHHPQKFYSLGHLQMHHSMGRLCIKLNLLRTAIREAELAAVAAFKGERGDIIQAMNRLSSLAYILIYKYLPEGYQPGPGGAFQSVAKS